MQITLLAENHTMINWSCPILCSRPACQRLVCPDLTPRLPVSRSCFRYNFVVSYTCSADRLLRYDNMLTCGQFFPRVLFYLLASILIYLFARLR